MRVVVDSGGQDGGDTATPGTVVAISIDTDNATVADLAAAVNLPEAALVIDGIVHLSEVPLADVNLIEGSRIGPVGPGGSVRPGLGSSWIGVVGGPQAGTLRRLDADGTVTIGRDPNNDLAILNTSVSESHAFIDKRATDLMITDTESLNGTWIDGRPITKPTRLVSNQPVRIGSSVIEYFDVPSDDKPLGTSPEHADGDGRVLFNRSPRGPVQSSPARVAVPEAIPDRASPTLTILSILIPLVIAGVMVLAFGSFRFALFALLSPLMVLGNWWSGKRRVGKERAGDARNRREALAGFEQRLERAANAERARRREFGPNLLEIRRRIELPSSRLWERRLDAEDALTVRIGTGTVSWDPIVAGAASEETGTIDEEVSAAIDAASTLADVEVLADLRSGPMGLVGQSEATRMVATASVLQLATYHGPADLSIVVLASDDGAEDWRWAQWLPHVSRPAGGTSILRGTEIDEYAAGLSEQLTSGQSARGQSARSQTRLVPAVLLVVADLEVIHRRSSRVRQLLERVDQNVFGIVLAPVQDQLPASVSTVVSVDHADGEFRRTEPARPDVDEVGIVDGVTLDVAAELSRAMARFDDPEMEATGQSVPVSVRPEDALGAELFDSEASAEAVVGRWWRESKRRDVLSTPLGIDAGGIVAVDLVQDGPHGLIAGTTGAGKSELLRSLVLGLALHHDPDDLVFVLIDYKGGSAFDRCARLPHVVGMVTDLDDHLAERALQSLEAELRYRETVLRDTRARDIIDYRQKGSPRGPLPRLVVVIDEFATLRSELPDFVESLVEVAQRGRSLGVHLILATQRPSGAVDANIRANTNLRIALRVQDAADSTDVIDDPGASRIDPNIPGRALVRRGGGDLGLMQPMFVSGQVATVGPPIRVARVPLGPTVPIFSSPDSPSETQLDFLVDAIDRAGRTHDLPRRPWLEPLPTHIADPAMLAGLESVDEAHLVLALVDDPGHQRRVTRGWNFDDGHLAVVGGPGSGVTTTLRSAITALGVASEERTVWVLPVDHGAGGLHGIDALAHVAELITGNDEPRQTRLLQFLSNKLDERKVARHRANFEETPLIVVAIDGIAGFAEVNEIQPGTPNGILFDRLGREGPSVGIHLLVGADSWGDLPRTLRNTTSQFIVLEQIDDRTYLDFSIRVKNLPTFVPGRALFSGTATVGHIVDWESAAKDGLIELSESANPPSIDELATVIPMGDLPAAKTDPDLLVPFGISDSTRAPLSLMLRTGDHCLVAGPNRSGRTTTLWTLARQLREADSDLVMVAVVPHNDAALLSELGEGVFDAGGTVDDLNHVLGAAGDDDRRWVIFVDDADRIDLEQGALFTIARRGPANVSIVAAVRTSTARQSYSHWSRFVRASGSGILLEPDPTTDGELFGVRLPRQRLATVPGRGYLIAGGEATAMQVAIS